MKKILTKEEILKLYKSKNEPAKELHFDIDREAIDEEKQIVPMSVSSDKPYKRWFGWETLDHKSNSIRLERFKNKAAFRDTHYGDQVGVILNPRIDKEQGKLRVDVMFSKNDDRAITLFKDIKDGIRQNVSIRYQVHEMVLEKEADDEAYYRVTDWEPIHASIEPDPADDSVGPNRAANTEDGLTEDEKKQLRILITNNKQTPRGNNTMTPEEIKQLEEKQAADLKTAEDKAAKGEQLRVKNIYTLANKFRCQVKEGFDIDTEASKFVAENKSADEFSDVVFQSIQAQAALRTNDAKIGLTDDQAKTFSITRAVEAQLSGNWDKAGFEKEVIVAARGKQVSAKGQITIPFDVLANGQFARTSKLKNFLERELNVTTATAGGNLVGTKLLPNEFIDVLRNKSVLSMVNATFLPGQVGDLAIPKKTAAGTAAWLTAEGADAADTNMAFGQLTFSPKDIGARTEWTRRLSQQATPGIDRIAEEDLFESIGLVLDLGGIHGSGGSGQPQGIVGSTGVGDVTGTNFAWATAVDFKKKAKIANAYAANMAYITNPTVEASLETTEKSSSTGLYLLDNMKMAGHPLFSTNQIAAQTMVFGDWSQQVIPFWGGLDLIIDATSSNDGNIKIKVFLTADIGLRYAGAFAVADDITFA